VQSIRGAGAGEDRETAVGVTASAGEADIDPNAVCALGSSSSESARLQRQADELAPDSTALLDRVGLRPGDSAIDLGRGPRGIIELLSDRVSPGGRVVGLDGDPTHVAMASELVARRALSDELDGAARKHFEDPDPVVMPSLMFLAWGRKPAAA
jgi:predicted methyltransferase